MDYKSGYDAGYRRGFDDGYGQARVDFVKQSYERSQPGNEPQVERATPKPRKAKNPKRVKAMKMAQKKARLKSGKFRKGWGKSRLMKEYHRILKRL